MKKKSCLDDVEAYLPKELRSWSPTPAGPAGINILLCDADDTLLLSSR